MKLSGFDKRAVIEVSEADVIALSDTEMEVTVEAAIDTEDTFQLNGETHTIQRSYVSEQRYKARFSEVEESADDIKQAFLDGKGFNIYLSNISISASAITGTTLSIEEVPAAG